MQRLYRRPPRTCQQLAGKRKGCKSRLMLPWQRPRPSGIAGGLPDPKEPYVSAHVSHVSICRSLRSRNSGNVALVVA